MGERFVGGSAVPGGYYLNAVRWAIEPVAHDGDRLPAGPGEWRRIPMVAALVLVPILGVTFLMFMPAAGFIVLGQHLWKKARAPFLERKEPVAEPPGDGEGDRPLKPEA